MVRILIDTYPEVVSNCLIQEIPHLEVVMDPGRPPVFIREQLTICLIERGALNMAIGETASSTLDTRDKALFQSLKPNLISNRCAATKEASDCMRLAIQNYARRLPGSKLPKHPEIQHWGPCARNGLPINPESLQWKQRSRHFWTLLCDNFRRKRLVYRGTPWEIHYAIYEEDEGRSVIAHHKEIKHEIVALQNPKTRLTGAPKPDPDMTRSGLTRPHWPLHGEAVDKIPQKDLNRLILKKGSLYIGI